MLAHKHAALMKRYAEIAAIDDKPWNSFEYYQKETGVWVTMFKEMSFDSEREYREKVKTFTLHGVEIPDYRINPKRGLVDVYKRYYFVNLNCELPNCYVDWNAYTLNNLTAFYMKHNMAFEYTPEGKEAAYQMAQAMLGIHPKQLIKEK